MFSSLANGVHYHPEESYRSNYIFSRDTEAGDTIPKSVTGTSYLKAPKGSAKVLLEYRLPD